MIEDKSNLLELIAELNEAQRKIVEATGGMVDAVLVSPDGPVLLPAAQQQLLRSETQFRQFAEEKAAILDALPGHIALLDPEGRLLAVNRAWREFTMANGLSGSRFGVGSNYPSACETAHGVDLALSAGVAQKLRAVLSGAISSFSLEYSCEDAGGRHWLQLLVSPMPDHSGYGAVVMHVDIGERMMADQRTVEIKQRLETLVSEATVGILVHRDWELIMANDEAARIFGYPSRDGLLALADFRELFPADEQSRIAAYNEARKTHGNAPDHYHAKARKLDGTPITIANHSFVLDWGGKNVICVMLTDVTDQLGTEAQLRQSLKMEAVGQLTGGIAHDFNNLLMVILSSAEALLEDESLGPEVRRRLLQIGAASERAADLTRSLLAFSRKLPLRAQRTDINELVVNTGEMLRRTLGSHIEVDSVLADDLWAADIDRAQLESALVNLSLNSRDAMPSGGRLLIETANVVLEEGRIKHGLAPAAGSYVMLAVTDTGSGIPARMLERVFEPFFTTKEIGKGTGLGLSMVYGFATQSGGGIDVSSELGEGTTIRLYLPRGRAIDTPATVAVVTIPRGSERILVVEDDALVRDVVVQQLQSLGYLVDQAPHAAAGLVVFEASSCAYDLLLTDINMPGPLSYLELAEAVTRRCPETRVLFMSGYSADAIAHGALDPNTHLLTKPFRKLDLARAIRSRLETPV